MLIWFDCFKELCLLYLVVVVIFEIEVFVVKFEILSLVKDLYVGRIVLIFGICFLFFIYSLCNMYLREYM